MNKKVKSVSAFILLCMISCATVFAQGGTLLYTDWYFNDDYSEVTVNGRPYDNYVIIWREFDKIRVCNASSMYLVSPDFQYEYTPEAYFNRRIIEGVRVILDGIRDNYPNMELLYINGAPWQDTEFRDYYLSCFESFTHFAFDNYRLFDFLSDINNNGYAKQVLVDEKSLLTAKTESPVEKLPVVMFNCDLYKDYQDYVDNGGQALNDIEFSSYEGYLNGGIPIPSEDPVEEYTYTTVVLYTGETNIYIIKNGVTEPGVLDAAPYRANSTTLIPVRGVLDLFGAEIRWFSDTKQVEVVKDGTSIILTIDSNNALVNGENVTLIEPAQIINDRTMIPLRFVSENLGCDVLWFEDGKIIISKTST